jgi:hypothetical protein
MIFHYSFGVIMLHVPNHLLLLPPTLGLILALSEQAVQAQFLSQAEAPTETKPNPDQPSLTPPKIPVNKAPAEETRPSPLRRHIGIGGSIGVSGDNTGLSEGGFTIMTRTDLNDWLSIRGTNVFGSTRNDNALALTVNLPVRSESGDAKLIPFVGGGVLISSESFLNNTIVRGLVTGGIDVPLSRRFTATTSVNVGFTEETSVGVRLGVMYGF